MIDTEIRSEDFLTQGRDDARSDISDCGVSVSASRDGDLSIQFTIAECSIGSILIATTGKGICAILIEDAPDALLRDLSNRFPEADITRCDGGLERLAAEIVDLVENPAQAFDRPLDLHGTDFQKDVWRALRQIPVGTTQSYSEIAARIGLSREAYAVSEACAANMIAIAIPCHRVIRKDGTLSGYRWGFKRKRALLKREGAI
ncbi:hypothetical protein BH10PSE7_BH10PSE7_32320 [soil metagenome]